MKKFEEALIWWTHHHTGRHFMVANLPITRQRDGHSCGILAWNAIATYLFPKEYQLVDARRVADERLRMFLHIFDHHNDKVRTVVSISPQM